jgi:hypothetical protein
MAPLVRRHAVLALFALAVLGCLAMAAYQLANRLPYPWDLYIWSESPFLTNLLKIDAGLPVFTPPEQANSFVYSPGLEYLTYALLRPSGRHLDIRYCRAVSVGFAVLAALALMRCSDLLRRREIPGSRARWFAPLSAAFFFLVIYHNFTSDVPHPDNLHIWHFAVTLMLTFGAIARPSAGRSASAVAFAGLAVLVKQTAAFSVVGVVAALVLAAPRRLRAAAWLVPLGVATSMAALGCLWSIGQARFYTFEMLSSRRIETDRIPQLLSLLFQEYRLFPLLLMAIALSCGRRSQDRTLKQLSLAYILVGIFGVGSEVYAFLAPMGWINNLGLIEVWAAVPSIPFLFSLLGDSTVKEDGDSESDPLGNFVRATTALLSFGLIYCYLPTKDTPQQSHYDYCRKFEGMVKADLDAGKRVLVAHGMSFQIRNNSSAIPLDRSNSFLELGVSGKIGLTGTERRVREGYYDMIYLNSEWYSPELRAAILENYKEVARIGAPADRLTTTVVRPDFLKHGFQPLHIETPILERRQLPAMAIGARPSTKR